MYVGEVRQFCRLDDAGRDGADELVGAGVLSRAEISAHNRGFGRKRTNPGRVSGRGIVIQAEIDGGIKQVSQGFHSFFCRLNRGRNNSFIVQDREKTRLELRRCSTSRNVGVRGPSPTTSTAPLSAPS